MLHRPLSYNFKNNVASPRPDRLSRWRRLLMAASDDTYRKLSSNNNLFTGDPDGRPGDGGSLMGMSPQHGSEGGAFRAELTVLRPLFLMAFLETCSVALIMARLPILLTTELTRQHQPLSLAVAGGSCTQSLAWASPSSADVRDNATARAAACPLPATTAAPCCAADGRLRYPDSCPPGVTALATAVSPSNNFHYKHAATCAAGNSAAARAQSFSDAAVLLLTFISSPAIGRIADAFGRRPVLLVAEVAHLLPSIALLAWAYGGASIYAFFVVRALTGAVNSISVALAYVADRVSVEHRAAAFGLLLATTALGVVRRPPYKRYPTCCCMSIGFTLKMWVLVWLPCTPGCCPHRCEDGRQAIGRRQHRRAPRGHSLHCLCPAGVAAAASTDGAARRGGAVPNGGAGSLRAIVGGPTDDGCAGADGAGQPRPARSNIILPTG